MKTKKWLSALLAATVLTSVAVPLSASAAADTISLNGVDGLVLNNMDEDDSFCKFEFSGDAMTLTRGESANGTVSSCYMSGSEMGDASIIDLEATPYLYWDTTGNATFDFYIRFGDGDSGLAKLSVLTGQTDGVSVGKGSINLLEAIQKNSGLVLEDPVITITAIKYVVNGNAGDSVTFNKLYLGPQGQEDAEPTSLTTQATDEKPTDTTAANTTKKVSSNPSTGESTQAVAATLVLAAAALGAVIVSKKKAQ